MSDNPCFRGRKPDEIPTASKAIRYFCAHCTGVVQEIRYCAESECWLYPWRMGTPTDRRRKLTPAQRARAIANLRPFKPKSELHPVDCARGENDNA